MKALPFKISKPQNEAIVYQEHYVDLFYSKLHQHEEIQLSLIISGEGTLIIGDTINYYKKGDILVIGSNLPHVFKSDIQITEKSHMVSLFFTKKSFGNTFFELEELNEVRSFFKRANTGFKATSHKKKIVEIFMQLKEASKFKRFLYLMQLLKITVTSNYKSLSSFVYEKKYSDSEGKRMQDVFEYTITHYKNNISLDTIAEVANMTKNAFCKYFKKRTNKTYINFLNELRIEHACKMIVKNKDYSIKEISIQSGYNSISNFNIKFKSIKKKTPLQYKLKYAI